MLLGLGIVTALVCIVRTVFSYETKAGDLTWQGIPNALCRMLEINFGIIAACMPMMRTFFIHIKKRYQTNNSESLASSHTHASQLQWFAPPSETPWYRRVKRRVLPSPAPTDRSQPSASSSNRSIPSKTAEKNEKKTEKKVEKKTGNKTENKIEKETRPTRPARPHRQSSRMIPRVLRPQHYERPEKATRPENATWAKDNSLQKMDSIDLPIQGPRNPGYVDEEQGEKSEYGTYRYDRGWT